MSKGARLVEAGPRVRHPDHAVGGETFVARSRTGPVRTCVGCRGRGPRSELLRVVLEVHEDGRQTAVVDPAKARPGRGAWIHADPACLELAVRRRAFPRALRTGPLDTEGLGAALHHLSPAQAGDARPSFIQKESGLEADGHPMSTQR